MYSLYQEEKNNCHYSKHHYYKIFTFWLLSITAEQSTTKSFTITKSHCWKLKAEQKWYITISSCKYY